MPRRKPARPMTAEERKKAAARKKKIAADAKKRNPKKIRIKKRKGRRR